MAMTIFERIIKGELPCYKVWESEEFLAFLDIRPVAPGHTLLIPKKAVDPIFDMEDAAYQRIFMAAKEVSRLLKKVIPCKRVCIAVVGFEVPHAHIHLIPCQSMADFPWPGGKEASEAELKDTASQLRSAFEK